MYFNLAYLASQGSDGLDKIMVISNFIAENRNRGEDAIVAIGALSFLHQFTKDFDSLAFRSPGSGYERFVPDAFRYSPAGEFMAQLFNPELPPGTVVLAIPPELVGMFGGIRVGTSGGTPALEGELYSPQWRNARSERNLWAEHINFPRYGPNAKHLRKEAGVTVLPRDARDVFHGSLPEPGKPHNRYGVNSSGEVYRFSDDGNGTYHFNGQSNGYDGFNNPVPLTPLKNLPRDFTNQLIEIGANPKIWK